MVSCSSNQVLSQDVDLCHTVTSTSDSGHVGNQQMLQLPGLRERLLDGWPLPPGLLVLSPALAWGERQEFPLLTLLLLTKMPVCPATLLAFNFIYLFIYLFNLFLAALGLRCYTQAFSSCGEQGLLFVAVPGLLIVVASLVVEHGL